MTRKRKSQADLAAEAAEAHCDLNIFAAVVAVLEGGTVSARAQPYDFRIIHLCQQAQQKCLNRLDRAMDALKSRAGE